MIWLSGPLFLARPLDQQLILGALILVSMYTGSDEADNPSAGTFVGGDVLMISGIIFRWLSLTMLLFFVLWESEKMDGLYDDIMQERIRAQAKSVHSGIIILCDSVQESFNGR